MGLSQRGEEAIALTKGDAAKVLHLSVGPHKEVSPGDYIPRADAQSPPVIGFPGASASAAPQGPYVAVCLDLDAPFARFPVLGPIAHWIQSDLQADAAATDTSVGTLGTAARPVCEWGPPGPPPGAGPHRYVIFLYKQPEGFELAKFAPPEGQATAIRSRMRFDMVDFEKRAGLGEMLAANYFTSN